MEEPARTLPARRLPPSSLIFVIGPAFSRTVVDDLVALNGYCTDLIASTSPSNLITPQLGSACLRSLLALGFQLEQEEGHRGASVVVLAAFRLTADHDSRRHMAQDDG